MHVIVIILLHVIVHDIVVLTCMVVDSSVCPRWAASLKKHELKAALQTYIAEHTSIAGTLAPLASDVAVAAARTATTRRAAAEAALPELPLDVMGRIITMLPCAQRCRVLRVAKGWHVAGCCCAEAWANCGLGSLVTTPYCFCASTYGRVPSRLAYYYQKTFCSFAQH